MIWVLKFKINTLFNNFINCLHMLKRLNKYEAK